MIEIKKEIKKKENKMIKFSKIIITLAFICLYSSSLYAEESKKDCSEIKNFYKRFVCKTNNVTSKITSKKNLTDFLPKK